MKRRVVAVVILAVCGTALLPLQKAVDGAQRAAQLRPTTLNLDLRAQVGQMGFLAALSGFRSPLAAYLWIEAYNAWERTECGRMAGLFNTVTALQPRSVLYWDLAAWHMAWNASIAALNDTARQPSEALRIRNQRQFFQTGADYLERGLRNNPDSYYLHAAMATLLRDKLEDHSGAADAFLKASSLPGAPAYYRRMAGYEMAKCPDREHEAYTLLKRLYNEGESQRTASVVSTLKDLEKKLDVPPADRIDSGNSQP